MKLLSCEICLLKLYFGHIQPSASKGISQVRQFNHFKAGCLVSTDPCGGGGMRAFHAPLSSGWFVGCVKEAWTSRWTSSGIIDFEEQEIQVKCIYSSQESFGSSNGWIYLYERMFHEQDVMYFKSQLQWDGGDSVYINILSVIELTWALSFLLQLSSSLHFKELSYVLQTDTGLFF